MGADLPPLTARDTPARVAMFLDGAARERVCASLMPMGEDRSDIIGGARDYLILARQVRERLNQPAECLPF